MGNWNLNSFPNDLLNGLIRHVEGVSGANDVKGVVHVVESGSYDSIEITLESFVVSGETVGACRFNDLVCETDDLILDALKMLRKLEVFLPLLVLVADQRAWEARKIQVRVWEELLRV